MSDQTPDRYVPALGVHWLTPAYDTVVRLTTRERAFKSALMEQASIEPGHRILDLACGTGTLAVWLKQRHPQAVVTGIDGDPKVLGVARRKAHEAHVEIDFEQGLSIELPYEGDLFDRVLSSLFFHHLSWPDKQRTAAELFRVTRRGGELHVADWGRAGNPMLRAAFYAVQGMDGFENTRDNVEGRLIDLFIEAGFTDVAERRTFTTMFGTMSCYSALKPKVTS